MQRWRHYEQRGDLGFVNVIDSRSQNSVISRLASLLGHRNTTRSFGMCLVLSILAWTKQLQDASLFINLILRAVAQRQCSRFQRYSLKTRISVSLERSPTHPAFSSVRRAGNGAASLLFAWGPCVVTARPPARTGKREDGGLLRQQISLLSILLGNFDEYASVC